MDRKRPLASLTRHAKYSLHMMFKSRRAFSGVARPSCGACPRNVSTNGLSQMAGRPIAAFSFAVLLLAATLSPLSPQEARESPATQLNVRELGSALSHYYEKPFDIAEFLVKWEQSGAPARDGVMGFLAGVFATKPDEIAKVTAATNLGPTAQTAVVQGLRLADRYAEASGAASGWGWSKSQIEAITPARPLRQTTAEYPRTFDVLWAASFATGDAAYVRPIFNYYTSVAAQDGIDAQDIVTIVVARRSANKEAVQAIAKKYPRETFQKVVFASTALWSLESNARQHKFVAAALDQYLKAEPNSPVAKGVNEVRAALVRR